MHLRFPAQVKHIGIRSWFFASLLTVILAVLVRAFVLETFKIPSSSMVPTLLVGDRIIVNKLAYGITPPWGSRKEIRWKDPQRDDLVVFYRFSEFEQLESDKHFIKRIVGVPGDIVEVIEYIPHINGEPLLFGTELGHGEHSAEGGRHYGPHKLAAGQYFVVGDNQSNSQDSRYFGPIHREDIMGKAVLVYWSWQTLGGGEIESRRAVRWDRIAKRIH